jgi:hypothetical protein
MKKVSVWLSRFIWLGILVDWAFGIPAIFAPEWTLRHLREPAGTNLPWVAFASLLLVLTSFFHIPIAMEPTRFPGIARLAVGSRLLQGIFFLVIGYRYFTYRVIAHLALFAIQAPLLRWSLRSVSRPARFPEQREENDVTVNDFYEYNGSTFAQLKEVVFKDPLRELPKYPAIGPADFIQLFNAGARNLADRRDIRPYFNKLIHTHGICATGTWEIDRDSPFTGFFTKGSKGLLLARLSVAGPNINRGQRRSFGIAGKIFPGMDPNQLAKPANFVTVSHLSGSRAKNIIDIEPTNAPTVGLDPASNLVNRIIFRLLDTRPGFRQLHPISTFGVPRGEKVVTPDLMILTVAPGTPRINADDFRDELRLENYPDHKLVYDIKVKNFPDERWTRIGSLTFTEAVVSEGGDKRLHFWIPSDLPSHN